MASSPVDRRRPARARAAAVLARRTAARLAAAALLLGTASAAPAQTFRETDPARTPGWVFTPTFAASGAWDDNVTLAGQRAQTASDTVAVLTPSGDLQWRGRHNTFNVGYNGSWSLYREFSDLNTYGQTAYADYRHNLSRRVSLAFHDSYSVHPTTDVEGLSGVPFVRAGSRMNDASGEATVALGRQTSASASYSLEYVSFDQDLAFARFLRGGRAHSVAGHVDHRLDQRLTVGASYTFRRALISGGGGRFDMQDAAGTVSYQPAPRLSLSGSLGYARLVDDTSQTSRTGPSWRVSATQEFERATVTGSYSRSYVPSFGLGGTQQNEEFTASLQMPLTRNRLYWQAGLSWRRNEPLSGIEQRLTSLWIHNWVGFALQRWLRVEAYYWRSQQDSQFAGGRVDRNRIGIQLVTARPMRIH